MTDSKLKSKSNSEAKTDFVLDRDYYYDEDGLVVFTESYLKERGYCCENGCRHCPYIHREE